MTLINWVLDLIYPPRCPMCDSIIAGETHICEQCKKELTYVSGLQCQKCGKTIEEETSEYCFDCSRGKFHYTRGYPVFEYSEIMAKSIYRFKYSGRKEYARFYAREIAKRYGNEFRNLGINTIIPVPISYRRRCERGYNQAELISKYLSQYTKIEYRTDILKRKRNTTPQKNLKDRQIRKNNLKNAFQVCKNSVRLNKVLLVDDIYTTGTTIEACSRELLANGVQQVYFTAVAIGKGM